MWGYLLTGIALVLVLEGVMPFLTPRNWRLFLLRIASQKNHIVRWIGFSSMLAGAVLMYLVHSGIFWQS